MIIIAKIILILLYILLFILGIILLICIIPFSYSIYLNIYNIDVDGTISVKWLRGFVGLNFFIEEKNNHYNLTLLGRTVFKSKTKEKTKKLIKDKKDKKDKKKKQKIDINYKELYKIFKDFIFKLLKKIKPKKFELSGTYGFENPAITGMLFGIISMFNGFELYEIKFYPTFIEEIIEVEVEIEGQIRLMSLITLLVSTIIKKPVRKLVFRKKERVKLQPKVN